MVSSGSVRKPYSIVQFDEDPAVAARSDSAEPSRKRSKVIESSIITNVRVGKNPNRGALSIFESSLVSSSGKSMYILRTKRIILFGLK